MALSQDDILSLPAPLVQSFRQMEHDAVGKISKHIGDVGKITVTDLNRVNELQRIGYNVSEIQRDIATTIGKSEQEIYNIFSDAAKEEYTKYRKEYDFSGAQYVPFAENKRLQELVEQISTATYGTFVNISRTTTIGLVGADGKLRPISETYQRSIDYAIMQVRTGQVDFHTAMRGTIKEMASNGLSYVEYETGYTRRLDSTVRMNLLGGMAQLSHAQAEMIGREFGADGMEISFHNGYRPTHDFGGQQFPMDEYRMDILPKMEEPNCYHRSFPIIIGVSTPTYSKVELEKLIAQNEKEREFEGKMYDSYDAQQKQRRYETAIREQKDLINTFEESGDEKGLQRAQIRLRQLNASYKDFSKAMEISTQPKRVTVLRKAK